MSEDRTDNIVTTYLDVDVVSYGGQKPQFFTYSTTDPNLQEGNIITIPFGRQQSLAIVRQKKSFTKLTPRQLKTIMQVLDMPPLPSHLLKLADWLKEYYVASTKAVWTTLLPSGLTAKLRQPNLALSSEKTNTPPTKIVLTDEQNAVVSSIWEKATQPFLLEGITGSGKTHIYETIMQKTLDAGQSVIIISPEIFLASQLFTRLQQRFGDQVIMTHSHLTAMQRRRIWLSALKQTEPRIYLGARSALFLPITKLGLIIVDEMHDQSYKQESAPRYHAREVSAQLAHLTGARLIYGSATPDLFASWLADHNRITRLNLTKRYGQAKLPQIHIVDMRREQALISTPLAQAIRSTLDSNHQCLLLLNRRGNARRLSCNRCGESVTCQQCDSALVFHADLGRLKCHICGRVSFPPSTCPACSSPDLSYRGFGTKQLEIELGRLFPTSRIGRIDRDYSDHTHLTTTLDLAQKGELDILLGTQMVAKGLDFARVTLVGILSADELSSDSDYSGRERAVALMMQTAGRAGRAEHPGTVFIQTRQPDSQIYHYIKSHDWTSFTHEELRRRQEYKYPPYVWLARLSYRHRIYENAEAAAEQLVQKLNSHTPLLTVLGPTTPLLSRERNQYIFQVILKAKRRSDIIAAITDIPADWVIDLDPISVI